MKKSILLLACALCTVTSIFAQQKIAVQSGNQTKLYDSLTVAIKEAIAGDVVYLPGTLIEVPEDIVIDRKLSIIGAGWDIDSTGGLNPTVIIKGGNYASVTFKHGSDGSLISGCEIGTVSLQGDKNEFNEITQDIKNITILRNYIHGNINLGFSTINNNNTAFIFENRITSYINGQQASDCAVCNNLIQSYVGGLKRSFITNNVITFYLSDITSCSIENNFISYASPFHINCNDNIVNNNAFTADVTFPYGSNTGTNNLVSQETIKTFQVNDLSHPKNLTIKSTSPCKNAGTDGKDIGLYGGASPYKMGAKPATPHIDRVIISNATNSEGGLKVDIKVSAQER